VLLSRSIRIYPTLPRKNSSPLSQPLSHDEVGLLFITHSEKVSVCLSVLQSRRLPYHKTVSSGPLKLTQEWKQLMKIDVTFITFNWKVIHAFVCLTLKFQ